MHWIGGWLLLVPQREVLSALFFVMLLVVWHLLLRSPRPAATALLLFEIFLSYGGVRDPRQALLALGVAAVLSRVGVAVLLRGCLLA